MLIISALLFPGQNYPVHLTVFYEALRLWPGVPKNARYAEEDDILPAVPELGIGEVKVNRGDYVLWSDRCMMRSEAVSSLFTGRELSLDPRIQLL